jgi:hypothetical protein
LGDGRLETKNYKGKDMQEVAVAQWGVIWTAAWHNWGKLQSLQLKIWNCGLPRSGEISEKKNTTGLERCNMQQNTRQ